MSCRNCEPRRSWKNWVSSGRLPYQITRYWEKKRYIQKIEKAKTIFPRSCRRGFVISCRQPGERRSSTQISDVAATPERKPPHVKYQPKMFENQVGVSDITWSKPNSV